MVEEAGFKKKKRINISENNFVSSLIVVSKVSMYVFLMIYLYEIYWDEKLETASDKNAVSSLYHMIILSRWMFPTNTNIVTFKFIS